jgi:hypothetical protein
LISICRDLISVAAPWGQYAIDADAQSGNIAMLGFLDNFAD